jgi:hypothetical protein
MRAASNFRPARAPRAPARRDRASLTVDRAVRFRLAGHTVSRGQQPQHRAERGGGVTRHVPLASDSSLVLCVRAGCARRRPARAQDVARAEAESAISAMLLAQLVRRSAQLPARSLAHTQEILCVFVDFACDFECAFLPEFRFLSVASSIFYARAAAHSNLMLLTAPVDAQQTPPGASTALAASASPPSV